MGSPSRISVEEIKSDCVGISSRWSKDSLDLATLTEDGAPTEYLVGGEALARMLAHMAIVADIPSAAVAVRASDLPRIEQMTEMTIGGVGYLLVCEDLEDLEGSANMALLTRRRAISLSALGVHLPDHTDSAE